MSISCKNQHLLLSTHQWGFTLVELMVTLFISGLVMATVGTLYVTSSKSFSKHDDIASMQQNLRGLLAILPMEIRLAGCDPTESKIPKILVATRTQFQFTRDIKGNAVNKNSADGDVTDADENLAYALIPTESVGPDGIMAKGGAKWNWGNSIPALGRQTGGAGGFQPVAENIEALEFNYILDDGTTTVSPSDLTRIRAVQVSILARATNPADNYLHMDPSNLPSRNLTYTTASGVVWTPPQDHYRRKLAITTIKCRNLM